MSPLRRIRFEQRSQHVTPVAVEFRARGCARRVNTRLLQQSEQRCVAEDTLQRSSAEDLPHVWQQGQLTAPRVCPHGPLLAPDELQHDRPRRPFVD